MAERASTRFVADEVTGCHVSTYSVGGHGYSQVGWNDKGQPVRMTTAHRAAWVATHGQIPLGMTVDHMCRNRRCVNVAHLRLLTNFENARRARKDWPVGDGECVNGHPPSSYVPRAATKHRNGFCRECFPELAWTIKEIA